MVTMSSISKEEDINNKLFYQQSLYEISKSVELDHVSENWDEFFKRHPICSVVYLKEDDRVVSYMYATPHRDYACYEDTDLKNWGVNFIQTHIDFQKKGYASMLMIYGFADMIEKGAVNVCLLPNSISKKIINKIVKEYNLSVGDTKFGCGEVILFDINKVYSPNLLNKRVLKP